MKCLVHNSLVTMEEYRALKTKAIASVIIAVILSVAITSGYYSYANSISNNTTITESYGQTETVSYIIFKKSFTYYAKNGSSGTIEFSGTNFTQIWQDCIDSLPNIYVQLPNPPANWVWAKTGSIFITSGNYTLPNTVYIPVGSVINIEGVSSNQENINNGMSGGTQIISTTSDSALVCDTSYGELSDVDGTQLYLTHIQFLQAVNLASATTPVLNLDGVARGKLDDVQVVKAAALDPYITGVGIRCYQFEDTGGYTEWNQVQVVGFSAGLNVSINHWLNMQQGVAKCETGIVWRVVLGNSFYNLHFQEVDFPFKLYGGFGDEEVAGIYGLYLEGVGYSAAKPKWICDDDFQGMIHIYQTNVHACGSNLWTWNMGWRWWYEDVFIVDTSPDFPDPSQPLLTGSGDWLSNENPQTVMLCISGDSVSDIWINSQDTHMTSGTFYLRPGDQFKIIYTVAPSVYFYPISAAGTVVNGRYW
jgi:hypothetical protein